MADTIQLYLVDIAEEKDYPNKDEELLVFFDGLLGKQLQTYNIKLSVVHPPTFYLIISFIYVIHVTSQHY